MPQQSRAGFRMSVPDQPGMPVRVDVTGYDDPPGPKPPAYKSPENTPGFTVIRGIASFRVRASGSRFTSPGKLTACYTQGDVDAAGGRKEDLKLGAWDGNNWQMLAFTFVDSCDLPGDNYIGAGEVEIDRPWPDPPVAWGR